MYTEYALPGINVVEIVACVNREHGLKKQEWWSFRASTLGVTSAPKKS